MSDPFDPVSEEPVPSAGPFPGQAVHVDPAAFLPEGTEVGDPATAPDPTPAPAGADDETVDLEALAAVEHDLDAVEQSLAALDEGSHGRCRVCGQAVPTDDLVADPLRRSCAAHA